MNVKGLVQVPKKLGCHVRGKVKDENYVVSNKLIRGKFPLYEDTKADFSNVNFCSHSDEGLPFDVKLKV